MTKGLQEIGWEVAPSTGGMFVWAKYPYRMSSIDFTFKLIEQVGIVTVPGTSFGTEGEGYVRIALIQNAATLQEAIERFATLTFD